MMTLTVPLHHEGRTFNLKYNPAVLASDEARELLKEMQESTDQRETREIQIDLLCRVLVGWDIHSEDGELLPISEHTFTRVLPWFFDALIVRTLMEHTQQVNKVIQPTRGPRFTPSAKVHRKRKGKRR